MIKRNPDDYTLTNVLNMIKEEIDINNIDTVVGTEAMRTIHTQSHNRQQVPTFQQR